MATTYYANPAGGNWSAAIWGTDPGGPFNLTWPDTTDYIANLNGATITMDVAAITADSIIGDPSSGGRLNVDTTAEAKAITADIIGGAGARAVWMIGGDKTLTVNGNVIGGSSSSATGLNISSLSGNVVINGTVTGGSASSAFGVQSYTVGSLTISGLVAGGSGTGAHGVRIGNGSATLSGGACGGSGINAMGVIGEGANIPITITGDLTFTNCSPIGGTATWTYTPGASGHVVLGEENLYSLDYYEDPGSANVKSGVEYEYGTTQTGSYSAGGGGSLIGPPDALITT